MARRKTAAKTKSTTTKKKNGSANKTSKKDDEKVKDNQKNKSVTTSTSSAIATPSKNNNNSSGGGTTTTIMDELNIKSTKLLKPTTTEKLQLHLLNNIDIKNMTNHNHNNNKNYNNQQQKNNSTTITTTATTTPSSTIINSIYSNATTGPPPTISSTQTTDNLIHRSSNNNQQDNNNSISNSTLLEPKNNISNNLNNNIDKSNNNREILISKINCQSTNNNNNHNNDKYLHKKFKRPASVAVIENNNNNNYLNINSPIPIKNSTTTNLINEQQHHLSIDSIGDSSVSGIVSDGNCNNSNNKIVVKENIDENFKNPLNNLISKSFTSSDKHIICENIINNSNYIGENGHDIIVNQKFNNIENDTEYQQKQNNNLIFKINSTDLIINNKKPIINTSLSKSTTIINENLIQKHNNSATTTEKSNIIKKPKLKHNIKGSLENSSTPIDIQQQQQLNENLDYNYIGKQSVKRLTTIKNNLPSGSTEFHKQTNDIFKIVNNNNNSNNINNKNIINNNINSSSSTNSPTISNNMHNSTNFNIINNNQKLDKKDIDQQQINSTPTPTILTGRHVCPYCNLNCTKPSVLQKHIRAHTNERPYPCDKCGIAFKTNSNYYKHCRSRSHLQRMKGVVDPQPNDDDGSLGSDQDPDLSNSSSDVISGTTSPLDERISSPAVQQLQHNQHYHHHHHHNQQNQLSSASSISSNSSTSSSIQKNSNDKPYKPKFHNAALYKDENITTTTTAYRPRHNQPQPQPPPQQQQQQSSLSPYSNKQNQMTILSATSNLHNINNHISETLSSNYYSAQSQFIQQQEQQQQQQILHNHSTYIHPSGINHHEQQQKHHRSQISVNCESAMVVGSSTVPHHQQHYTQQISSSAFQQSVAPVYNPETTGITNIPLVVRDSTGSGSNFGGGSNNGGSLATATTGGGHQLNVEFLQEHISKLISQNQAIVENKEVLLQKKYPKQLNKQKSLSSLVIPTSSSIMETSGNLSSVTTPLNSKLQLALVNKQQQQQQQQQQHHHQQQLQLLFQQRDEILNRNSQNMNGFLTITNNNIPSPAPRLQTGTSNKNLTHQILEPSISSQQPLNLSKVSVVVDPPEIINTTPSPPLTITSVKTSSGCRKRSADDILSSSNSNTPTKTLATHPQNPERSIIKHLLLNARGLGIPNGEGDDAVYTCPLCKLDFQNAEELKHHTSHYCQGGPSSAPISPVASPSYKYFRSNSINVNLPEFNNPTSLATLAKSSLLHGKNPLPLAKLAFYRLKTKQSNLILNQLNVSTGNSTNNTTLTSANIKNDNNNEIIQKLIDAPLPSPGPLLGKTQLVESYNPASNSDHKSEDVIITKVHEERNFPSTSNKEFYNAKKIKYDNQHISHNNYTPAHGQTFFGGGNMFESQSTQQKPQFLMCSSGGDIQIIDKKDNNVMKRFMSSGGCIEPISESITSPKFFRTPLLSGGSFTEILPQENQHSQQQQQHQQQQHKKHEANHQLSIQQHIKPKIMIPITPLTPSLSSTPNIHSAGSGLSLSGQHFQFPPINSITGFNPLTLPPINSISHSPVLPNGEKLIPYVPGIPGPNTMSLQLPPPPQRLIDFTSASKRNSSPNRIKTTSPMVQESRTPNDEQQNYHYRNSIQKYQQKPIIRIENIEINCTTSSSILQMSQNDLIVGNSSNLRSIDELLPQQQMQRSPKIGAVWIPNTHVEPQQQQQPVQRKSFNFTRMADNISPKKPEKINLIKSSIPVKDQSRHFNFENLSTIKTEIKTEDLQPLHVECPSSNVPLTVPSLSKASLLEPLLPPLQQSPQNPDDKLLSTPPSATTAKRTKFLRPTSLPLKPGTFTPKRHHGITPTANTMPLISPETPRPSKTCGQMFLNGHAYTYLGLKCSTKMFYCTVNCPQPSYVANLHKLSMYSVWQVQAEKNLHPLGLKPKTVMALYDSRQRNCTGLSMANIKLPYTSVHSQHTVMTPFENNTGQFYHHQIKSIPLPQIITTISTSTTLSSSQQEQTNIPNVSSTNNNIVKDNQKGPILVGGYESNEDYTYIRGRGRGKYVCSECGIRCKKPSMLVKHIRTHSDIRPYTCLTCKFSFKTKGNLTKHMQSKAHYKRCLELGVDPGEGLNGEFVDREGDNDQQSVTSGNDRTSSIPGESDSEYGSDADDRETESSDTDESKSRLPEHEAAHCLLSLSMTPPSNSVSPHYRSSSQLNYDNDKQHQTINSNNSNNHRLDDIKNQQQNINARRVISFTSPKPPFDYQKQEKYYSNPLVVVPKNRPIEKFDENIMKPIDLTKPRCSTQQQLPIVQQLLESSSNQISNTTKQLVVGNLNDNNNSKITDVIGNLSNESVFHKSLLSITDKIRIGGNNNTDSIEFTGHNHHSQKQNDDILFQAYLTEQALQYTKIKQSQMSSKSFNSDDIIKTTNNIGLIVTTTTATTSLLAGGVVVDNLYNYNKILKRDNINSKSPNLTTITDTTTTTQSSNSPIVSTTLITSSNLNNKLLGGDKLENNEIDSIPLNEQSSIKEVALDMPRITDSPIVNEILTDSNLKLNKTNTNTKDSNESNNTKLSNENSQIIRTSSMSKQKDNAKSVASEYLKITQKTNSNSNNNSGKLQNDETNPDDEDSSDQEIPLSTTTTINTTNTATTTTDTTNIKPSNDFSGILARTVIVGEDGFKSSTTPTDNQKLFNRVQISDDNGRPICTICSKTFQKQHQLVLHMNIHYMERKFKCEPCAVSFRTQGHLQKHERSEAHKNKVMMTSTFGVPTTSNPRPYECSDCKVAFRIHGHLAKHLRSKTHVQKLECSQKLPFGTYAEIERAGISLTEIDTTDCDNSLASLKILAQKLFEKDPSKLSAYTKPSGMEINSNIIDNNCESGSEDNPDGLDENQQQQQQGIPVSTTNLSTNDDNNISENRINNAGISGGGIKRKFDSFSSCSNDSQSGAVIGDNRINISTTIATGQESNNNNSSIVGGDEKRLRSTNLTK